ncbi:molecular chaperone [Halorientalis sp. IM1011]|uniref:J domain-containing protein n=1 Tax=Halorientalis sp. IM1011 TaxID=1932360 RepID=UPI00097CD67D|nr:J domain-containing protein [Halorientalis sp. IM1011]AQL41777.1 molecular chaperone [Halorientalis sp. IM1011]
MPQWLIDGALLGFALSAVIAALFYVGVTRFPGRGRVDGREPSGEAHRRDEIRTYLDAIGEQYAEGHFVEGQHVAFYLPKRDVAITFDARAYYRIERSATFPVLVEHELPGVALGPRLPFETPEISFEEDGGGELDPREAAHAVLGLPVGAGLDDIKRAYREKVKEVHPDHGGDEDEFKRVREAYTTAKQHAS